MLHTFKCLELNTRIFAEFPAHFSEEKSGRVEKNKGLYMYLWVS